ncbi:MAG: DEAD/DEAH box helicase family protein [Chloroflexota bacterium]
MRGYDVVVNSYRPGSGKTRAALLHLLDRVSSVAAPDALIVAPTNELVRQHVDDARNFARLTISHSGRQNS